MTFTGLIGRIFWFPLRLIISACVSLRIHPNILTFVGVLINVAAAVELARGHFIRGGVIMVVANIFDFIDGKVAHEHIYWDQASVLVQIGLLDPKGLPVAGVETARKIVDQKQPSNGLMGRWVESAGKPL